MHLMGAEQYNINRAEQRSTDSLMVGMRFESQNLFSFSFFFATSFKDAHYAYTPHTTGYYMITHGMDKCLPSFPDSSFSFP